MLEPAVLLYPPAIKVSLTFVTPAGTVQFVVVVVDQFVKLATQVPFDGVNPAPHVLHLTAVPSV